jgi:hypothetical protein
LQLTIVHARGDGLVDLPLSGITGECHDHVSAQGTRSLGSSDLSNGSETVHYCGRSVISL